MPIPVPTGITVTVDGDSLIYDNYEVQSASASLSVTHNHSVAVNYTVSAEQMAFTDFRYDSLDAGPPIGWDNALEAGFTLSVSQDAAGDNYMRLYKPAATAQDGVKWTSIGDHQDVEIFCEWVSMSAAGLANRLKMIFRGTQDTVGTDHTFYGAGMGQGTRKHRIIKYNPGFTELGNDAVQQIPEGTRVRMRVRIEGTTISLKVWQYGDREPRDWFVRTDPDITVAGLVGLLSYGTGTGVTDTWVYKYSVLFLDNNPSLPEAYVEPDVAEYNQPPVVIGYPFTSTKDATIWFPDGWLEERDGGARNHRSVDMYDYQGGVPVKGAAIHAVTDGVVAWKSETFTPTSGGGYQIHIDHPDGDVRFAYLHMGDDDGGGTADQAFANNPRTGVRWDVGDTIFKGEVIGYLGDSGATISGAHLHFEIRSRIPGGTTPSDDRWSDPLATPGTADYLRWNPITALWDAQIRNDYPDLAV